MDKIQPANYTTSIKGVEIFATGTWNGDEYTEKDLDDMLQAFKELDYRPALKVGHTKDEPGAPAYGWVKNLRKVGSKLVADFEDLDDSVGNALRKRAYDRVSSEVYFNLKRGEKVFRRALKAVALLGAEVPAVAELKPIGTIQFAESGFDKQALASEMALVTPESEAEKEAAAKEAATKEAAAKEVAAKELAAKELAAQEAAAKELVAKALVDAQAKEAAAKEATAKELAAKEAEAKEAAAKLEASTKESTMTTTAGPNAEQIQALQAQAEEIAGKLQALKAGGAKEDDKEYKALAEQVKMLAEKITTLAAEDGAVTDVETLLFGRAAEMRKELSVANAKAAKSEEEQKKLLARVEAIEREKRLALVGEKCRACKLPKFRPGLNALYAYALEHQDAKVKVFSQDKEGKDVSFEKSLPEILDDFVTEINDSSERLFKALAYAGTSLNQRDVQRELADSEDPAGEVDRRIKKYRVDHPDVKTYEVAMRIILESDRELAARYRAQLGREQ